MPQIHYAHGVITDADDRDLFQAHDTVTPDLITLLLFQHFRRGEAPRFLVLPASIFPLILEIKK
ncbi:hypothetical protein P3S38_25560, partial [Enterobacter hormaechei]|uniref:hypothetical protein n=1 Tax=Enterobacter hormaechei TaxID=158836 RepID=UPI0023E3EFDB